jgi:thioredoxin-related protein
MYRIAGMLLLLVGISFFGRTAELEGWTSGFEAAKTRAKKENKDMLLDFTGSDWCAPCKLLIEEVFAKEPFKSDAPKKFVLVTVDFPRNTMLAESVTKQNNELADYFNVSTFPSIILLDSSGRMYARTEYQPGGSEKYVEHLNNLVAKRKERDEALAAADKLQGVERARILDGMLSDLQKQDAMVGYNALIENIIELDSDNKAGLKAKYELIKKTDLGRRALKEAQKMGDEGNWEGALKKSDELLQDKDLPAVVKQEIYVTKAQIHDARGEKDKLIDNLEKAIALDPNSDLGKNLVEALKQLKAEKK